jgi:hypothetical protein
MHVWRAARSWRRGGDRPRLGSGVSKNGELQFRLAFVAALCVVLAMSSAGADEIADSIKTAAGTIQTVKRNTFDYVLNFNGQPLQTESGKSIDGGMIEFTAILPSRTNPRYVVITYETGGNACDVWGLYVLKIAEQIWLSDDLGACAVTSIKPRLQGNALLVEVTGYDDANDLGDAGVVVWRHDGTQLRALPKSGVPNFWEHEGIHPAEFLGTQGLRKSIVATLGEKFRDLRDRLNVASNMETVGYRYLVGTGCMAHMCGIEEGFLIVDGYSGRSWAFYTEEGKEVRAFGPKSKSARVPHISPLREWLAKWDIELARDTAPIGVRPLRQR